MRSYMRIVVSVVVSCLVIVYPLFPYSNTDILDQQKDRAVSTGLDGRNRDILVPGPFDDELSKAGRVWNIPEEIPIKEYETETPVQAEPEPEPSVPEHVPEPEGGYSPPEVHYISAGPDGYGYAGSTVYIGCDRPVPEDISLLWRQTQGAPLALDNPEAPYTWFIPRSAGVYEFALDVILADGSGYTDTVQVLVDEINGNRVPLAYAGEDFCRAFDADAGIPIQGRTCDADNDMLSCRWIQTGGPSARLFFEDTEALEFIPSSEGIYTFELTASDGCAASLPDDVSVNCFSPGNNPPVAVAEDRAVPWAGTPFGIMLEGSMSYDPDGDTLSFSWIQTDGPPTDLSDPGSPCPRFLCREEGYYWFELQVDDGTDFSLPEEISVSVVSDPAGDDNSETGGCMPSGKGSGSRAPSVFLLIACAGILLLIKRKETHV